MKNKILLFIILFALLQPGAASAQSIYQPGNNVLGVGLGLGSSYGSFTYGRQSPALNVQYERGIWPLGPGVISLGGYLGYKRYQYSANYYGGYTYSQKWNYTIIGLRSAWHLQQLGGKELKKWDLYSGVMLSYNVLNYSYADNDPYWDYAGDAYGSGAGFAGFLGARYFFNGHFAAMGEVGYGIAFLNLGMAYKF
jgi:hypothetical protein